MLSSACLELAERSKHGLLAIILVLLCTPLSALAQTAQTPGGIPLDAPWKVTIFTMAHTKFVHPAWGWQHSERNYLLGMRLAKGDGLAVDSDVLFAAAFLHDMSAFLPCTDKKMEHGDCAAQQSGKILAAAGFPMQKLAAVQGAERGHMFYSDPGATPAAIVLHDADSLDFLGFIGAARMFALTGEKAANYAPAVKSLRSFLKAIPPRLLTRTGRAIGAQRSDELRRFLDGLVPEETAN